MHALNGLGSFMGVLSDEHKDLSLLICMILWDFVGQVNSEPFAEVTSGRLQEETQLTLFMGTPRELEKVPSSPSKGTRYRQGKQSVAIPRLENQSHWISNEFFSGSETDESWAPLPTSGVCFIQRIMVMAKSFSYGLKALRPVLAHFSPRNQQELPDISTASLLTIILRGEVCLRVLSSFSTLQRERTAHHLFSFWPPFLFRILGRTEGNLTPARHL